MKQINGIKFALNVKPHVRHFSDILTESDLGSA